MRLEGVRRMVFASTNHVTGYYELKGRPCYPEMPVRPDGYYGASKAFGEALSRFYVDEHGLEVICLRIGSWLPEPKNVRNLSTWLSPRDMAQLTWRAIETPLTWGIFYAISANTRRYWDIGPTQELLGFESEDDAETYADTIEAAAARRRRPASATTSGGRAMDQDQEKKRYAIVGLGARSAMYSTALWEDYNDHSAVVGFCDINQSRMDYYNRLAGERYGLPPIPTYRPDEFGRMLAEGRVETVIVTSMDRTHHRFIIAAMEAGCDVITEKPLTVDAAKCQQILDVQRRTGRRLAVTFNYRYAPRASKVKELLQGGAIGKILSVHFEWLLDTQHGADYFRRWHRDKRNSGGLMVHKATHHFDLVNWWLDSSPETVFAFGDLKFYGRENAEERGVTRFYDRAARQRGGERRPRSPSISARASACAASISTPSTRMAITAISRSSAAGSRSRMTWRCWCATRTARRCRITSPPTRRARGSGVSFNGTKGRLDLEVAESPYVSGARGDFNMPELRGGEPLIEAERPEIIVQPLWGRPVAVPYETGQGGHGGGDVRLLADLFEPEKQPDPLDRAAGHLDGARSILTGIAANQAMRTGLPVRVADLVKF